MYTKSGCILTHPENFSNTNSVPVKKSIIKIMINNTRMYKYCCYEMHVEIYIFIILVNLHNLIVKIYIIQRNSKFNKY